MLVFEWSGSRAAALAPGSPDPHCEVQLPRAKTALPSLQLRNENGAIPMMKHLCGRMQECLKQAEEALIQIVKEKYHALNEEMITHLFWCELKYAAAAHNERGAWSDALVQDLKAAFPDLWAYDLQRDVGGLFCDVHLHNHQREGKTGGDFGLLTSLPVIEHNPWQWSASEISIPIRDRAVLVQAKLRRTGKTFRKLGKNQKKLLPVHAAYSAVVLYGYDDKNQTSLSHFQWQSCAGMRLEDMEEWLKSGALPERLDSAKMICRLYDKQLGTDDDSIIRNVIATGDRPRFEIELRWPDRPSPDGPTIKLANPVYAHQQVYAYERRG